MPKKFLAKHSLALKLAALVAVTPLAIDTYLPAIPTIAEALDADIPIINLTVSIYLLGFALGQIIGGPLSDRLGRKPVAIIGLLIFFICSIAISQVASADGFLLLRFLQALGGGHASVVAGAIVRDRFKGQESAKVFSTIGMIMMAAPLLAPAIGSILLEFVNWQGIFIFLAIYAALLLVMLTVGLEESRKPASSPTKSSGTPDSPQIGEQQPPHSILMHYWHSYASVFRARASLPHLISQACVSGILFTLITNASFIYIHYFGVSESAFPLFFAAVTGCSIVAGRFNLYFLKHHQRLVILRRAASFQLLMAASLGAYILFGEPNLWLTVIFFGAIVTTMGFSYSNNMSLYLDHHGDVGGSANAIFGCATFTAGALLGGVSSLLHDGTLLPVGLLMLLGSLCNFVILTRIKPQTLPPTSE
ncbi:MAG: hypothetical protein CL693_06660 [Cellvibrionaceae bacterium]|nr:hypothetical protein [Cellvibrionaceae bacterium]|tara:strand:+ start:1043 stop:2302 length:1260 start_codon:yes stop_codon:yes gene_type:complete